MILQYLNQKTMINNLLEDVLGGNEIEQKNG